MKSYASWKFQNVLNLLDVRINTKCIDWKSDKNLHDISKCNNNETEKHEHAKVHSCFNTLFCAKCKDSTVMLKIHLWCVNC